MTKPIQIVDLFAGPGGLGEGFNSVRGQDDSRLFRTLVSVEKETSAHRTLTLRAFYRILLDSGKDMAPYLDYIMGGDHPGKRKETRAQWAEAELEALKLELGRDDHNDILDNCLELGLDHGRDWVLIGGPPCQAYSVVGRVRNRSNKDYRPEEDKRHFLYREYLDVIARHAPAMFVMENVKGILTSRVGKERIFGQILEDLHNPVKATGWKVSERVTELEERYTIFSLSDADVYYPRIAPDLFANSIKPLGEDEYLSFVVKAESHGIPQARHRVILIGVRNDIVARTGAPQLARQLQMEKLTQDDMTPAWKVLEELPPLRSGLSRNDSVEAWYEAVSRVARHVGDELLEEHGERSDAVRIAAELHRIAKDPHRDLNRQHTPVANRRKIRPTSMLERWYHGSLDPDTTGLWFNHSARSHMEEDLARYLYCAAFAHVQGRSPIGTRDIYLDSLAPRHANWKSGKFADRFKVVLADKPSKTITSHISKDGHYFIHYDPRQCRTLTVREAARLQTFPDDYYFEGNRTEQYVQVGNAVPPLLARQIAEKVVEVLDFQPAHAEAIQA